MKALYRTLGSVVLAFALLGLLRAELSRPSKPLPYCPPDPTECDWVEPPPLPAPPVLVAPPADASTSRVPTFCDSVQRAYRDAGEPQGNQEDWLWHNYAAQFPEALGCLAEYNDDPPPLYLDGDVRSITPITPKGAQ